MEKKLPATLTDDARPALPEEAQVAPPARAQASIARETPGRYEVGEELARGAQSVVQVAHDTHLGREVAFKTIREGVGGHSEPGALSARATRFVREARVTAQLEHPGIAPLYEVGQRADGSYYATQKLVRGRTLAEALQACRFPRERFQLLPAFLGICQAVAYAHRRGVIHRDLKPRNVMLGPLGEAVVIDWGLARTQGEDRGLGEEPPVDSLLEGAERTQDGAVLGTPAYMSPEQALGASTEVDERSDVWSLGIMLYELLAGRRPFEGSSSQEVLKAVVTGGPPPIRQLCPQAPADLVAVVERALRRAPAERYPDAAALAQEVGRWLSGDRVVAYEYRSWELLTRFMRRNPLATGLAALFLLGLVAGSLVLRQRYAEARHLLAESYLAQGQAAMDALRWEEAEVWFAASRVQEDSLRARLSLAFARQHAPKLVSSVLVPDFKVTDLCALPDGGVIAAGVDGDPGSARTAIELRDPATSRLLRRRVLQGALVATCADRADEVVTLGRAPDGGSVIHRLRLPELTDIASQPPASIGMVLADLSVSASGRKLLVVDSLDQQLVAYNQTAPQFVLLPGAALSKFSQSNDDLAWLDAAGGLWVWPGGESGPARGNQVADATAVRPFGTDKLLVTTRTGTLQIIPRAAHAVGGAAGRAPLSAVSEPLAWEDWLLTSAARSNLVLWQRSEGAITPLAVLSHGSGGPVAMAMSPSLVVQGLRLRAGDLLNEWALPAQSAFSAATQSRGAHFAAISGDGSRLAVGLRSEFPRSSVRVIDLRSGQRVAEFPAEVAYSYRQQLSFSRDGSRLAVLLGSGAAVYELAAGSARSILEVAGTGSPPVALSPDGRLLLVAAHPEQDADGIQLWEVEARRLLWTRSGSDARSAAFSADSMELTLANESGRTSGLLVVEAQTGRVLRQVEAGQSPLYAVARSRTGDVLAGGHEVWLIGHGARPRQLAPAGAGPHWSVAISEGGEWMAASGSERVRLWHRGDDSPALEFHQAGASYFVALAADGSALYHAGDQLEVFTLSAEAGPDATTQLREVLDASQLDFDGQQMRPRPPRPP
jgi:serine/threonine protein kinase